MSNQPVIFNEIIEELVRATNKFPTWPTDPIHAMAVLGEEYGELNKAILERTYEPHKSSFHDVRKEAIQTAAMALRFAMSMDTYRFAECEQHKQSPITDNPPNPQDQRADAQGDSK